MAKFSILDDICDKCTALERGQRLGERAATVGFDWPEAAQALAKVHEEVAELEQALDAATAHTEAVDDDVASELGDVLFALVNVARKLGIDAEQAMERTNRKFACRFRYIEDEIARQGRQLADVDLDEMEALWQVAKDE